MRLKGLYEKRRFEFRSYAARWVAVIGSAASIFMTSVAVAQPGTGTAPDPALRPAAAVAGQAIEWSELTPRLAEAAGGLVLEEAVLDRLIASEFRTRGLTLRPDEVDQEAALLAETLARSAGESSADDRARLIDAVRRSRGLGEARYRAMLKRSAMLRRLIQPEVKITEDDLRQAFAVKYGPKHRIRLLVVRTHADAARLRAELVGETGAARPAAVFAEAAVRESIDATRVSGGALEPLSTADPAYPAALRQAIAALDVGQVSQPIAVEGGIALVRLDERLPPSTLTLEEVEPDLRREVRTVRERILMDRLASRLLAGARVTIFDSALEWSWRGRQPDHKP